MLKSILVGTSLLAASLMLGRCGEKAEKIQDSAAFITIQGQDLIKPDGTKLFIMGTNLGNWLNPEGYMFKFSKTNSPRFINEMFCQLVGPDFTAEFWKAFKDNYITREDIQFIKNTGANTIRLPFHYKLFTDEDFMGLTAGQDGFIFHFFSSYIGKTFDTYPIFARYPKELENEDKYRVQDNVSISEELKKISEKQDTYFELLTRYLESQK